MEKIIVNFDNLRTEDINEKIYRPRAIMINSDKEILLGFCDNTFQFPGGFLEQNETLIEGLRREILEETGISLDNGTDLKVKGVFIYIGYRPATEFVPNEILDENGYVKVNDILETNIKGVYAIGDILKKDTYQLVTAASDGARVIYNMK